MDATTKTNLYDCRDAFASVLEKLAAENEAVVAVCNDSVGSSKLGGFKSKFPERLVNVGIAEQNMVGVGAGLANGGRIPFVCGASASSPAARWSRSRRHFLFQRQCEADRHLFRHGLRGARPDAPLDRGFRLDPRPAEPAGHRPCDRIETAAAVAWAATYDGPVFLRLSRVGVPDLLPEGHVFEVGKANVLRDGTDVTLIANGTLTHRMVKAAEILAKDGIKARVLNMATVRPIDEAAIIAAAKETGAIVTAEEHSIYGGLGSAVAEVVVDHAPVPMKRLGVPGIYAPTGSAEFLLDEFGMAPSAIAEATVALLRRK